MDDSPTKTPIAGEIVPRPNGRGALKVRGNPGNKGGGRHPDAFKAMCRELASGAAVRANVERILSSPETYPGLYIGALKWATEHGYGKPQETVHTTSESTITIKQEWTFGNRKVGF